MMQVVITVVLSVLCLAGGLRMGSLLARRRFSRSPGAFACRLRLAPPRGAGAQFDQAPWRSAYAAWAHNVLVVARFGWFVRWRALPVRFAEGHIGEQVLTRSTQDEPVVLALELDDRTRVLVSAAPSSASRLAGPFLTALMPGTPGASADRSGG